MSKLCRQVSIESPGPTLKECVFNFDVPVPDVPPYGARLRVAYAGACYRANRVRSASICSTSSISSMSSVSTEMDFGIAHGPIPGHVGIRDGALFPGYEVAGVVDALGDHADRTSDIKEGSRVILYPNEGVPHGYAEYIVVPDCKWDDSRNFARATDACKEKASLLIVGTGGLALWALRIATQQFTSDRTYFADKVKITVATLKDEAFVLIKKSPYINVVQWTEDLYEKQLIERTLDACGGPVDVVMNFGTTSRTLNRSLQCLASGGVILVTEDVGEKLLPKFARRADELSVNIVPVPNGSIEQLQELVQLVAHGQPRLASVTWLAGYTPDSHVERSVYDDRGRTRNVHIGGSQRLPRLPREGTGRELRWFYARPPFECCRPGVTLEAHSSVFEGSEC
ncbi:hypothetical protein EVAR_48924_1 [Eumeta japonica]|uniref:Uncharacterized protein n=1 Tax=Eumeta variegata TaxID=151549 RepID=A0A4C1YW61_EUMVA|nr:hypothetical protein EVAR_48924_1 [Eumeta japonica]